MEVLLILLVGFLLGLWLGSIYGFWRASRMEYEDALDRAETIYDRRWRRWRGEE